MSAFETVLSAAPLAIASSSFSRRRSGWQGFVPGILPLCIGHSFGGTLNYPPPGFGYMAPQLGIGYAAGSTQ